MRIPAAQANLAKIPDELTDEQVVLLADIASTGFSGAESGGVRLGDTVVVFAQGPIGLCSTLGAKLIGASLIIGVDGDETRLAMAKRMGADVVIDYRQEDVVARVKTLPLSRPSYASFSPPACSVASRPLRSASRP